MVIQKIKAFGIKFAVSAVLVAAPLVALGGVSHANGTVNWTGQGSDSVKACASGQTPFLHWIFTTGGNSSVTAATLTVSGTASGSGAMTQNGSSGKGSWSKYTAYSGTGQPTTSTVSAHVTYTGSLGNGNANLVISSGCFGSGGSGGGQGGGGGTTTTTTTGGQGQVLGTSGQAQSQVSQVPVGSANGGSGGISDFSLTSLARDW